MPQPGNLIDGFVGGQDTVFRYVAAPEDVGFSVVANWTIGREFTTTGESLTLSSSFSLTAQLSDSKGSPAGFFLEYGTNAGPFANAAIVTSGGGTQTLSQTGEIANIADEASITTFVNPPAQDIGVNPSGRDYLTQSLEFSFQPRVAGQEFSMHLQGAFSQMFSTPPPPGGEIPEPATLLIWSALIVIGLSWSTWRRRKR